MNRSSLVGARPKAMAKHKLEKEHTKKEVAKQDARAIRAAHRQQLHGAMPALSQEGQKTFLECRTVTLPRWMSYKRAWDEFLDWGTHKGLPVQTLSELDIALTNKLNEMFFLGYTVADAATLQAAVKFFRDDVVKTSALPRSVDAMKGYRKLEPAQGRVPMPWPLVCVVVQTLWDTFRDAALWMLTIWGTCCRPGEALKLKKKHLVAPSRLSKFWIVILNAGQDQPGVKRKANQLEEVEQIVPSKVGELDEAILLDQPYLQGLGPVLCEHVKGKRANNKMFDVDPSRVVTAFNEIITAEGYDNVGVNCMYQLRHGSASTDVLDGLRTLTEVQKRGRWQAQKSVRRYSNGGRVSQVFSELTEEQKAKAMKAEAWMAKTLGHGGRGRNSGKA
jgi:integrase